MSFVQILNRSQPTGHAHLPHLGYLSTDCHSAQGKQETSSHNTITHTCNIYVKMKVLVTQSCPTLCDHMDCSPPGFSIHGILQETILEWIAIPFSRGSSQSRDQAWVSWIAGRFFTIWATREAHNIQICILYVVVCVCVCVWLYNKIY